MTVLLDPPAWPAHGRLWSHLASDASFEELHAFARAVGVPARGFEGDHYDVPAERYLDLVAAGAVPVPARELLRRLTAAGLRRPKLRGERVITSVQLQGSRTDVVVSPHWPPRARVREQRLLVRSGRDRVLVQHGALPVVGEAPAGATPVGQLREVVPGEGLGGSSVRLLLRADALPGVHAGVGPSAAPGPLSAVADAGWRVLVAAVLAR